jgi:hypothetical protein
MYYLGRIENIDRCIREFMKIVTSGIGKPAMRQAVPPARRSVNSRITLWTELTNIPVLEEAIYCKYELGRWQFDYPRWTSAADTGRTKFLDSGAESTRSLLVGAV